MRDEKQVFLIVYDYGEGGLWGVMSARNRREIEERYPELTVLEERPAWMSPEEHREISERNRYDIDGPVTGLLKVVVAERDRG